MARSPPARIDGRAVAVLGPPLRAHRTAAPALAGLDERLAGHRRPATADLADYDQLLGREPER